MPARQHAVASGLECLNLGGRVVVSVDERNIVTPLAIFLMLPATASLSVVTEFELPAETKSTSGIRSLKMAL
jgi:hypothetical protein